MAVMVTFRCMQCGETRHEARSSDDHSNICSKCKREEADQKRREFLGGRAALSVEERLALIEQWMYDHRSPLNPRNTVYG